MISETKHSSVMSALDQQNKQLWFLNDKKMEKNGGKKRGKKSKNRNIKKRKSINVFLKTKSKNIQEVW